MLDSSKNLSIKDIEGELWLPVAGFDKRYHISNMGRLKKLRPYGGDYILSQSMGNRYLCFSFPRWKRMKCHRLVALHFVDNPDNKPYINHLDGNPLNNEATNLAWCTASENMQHAYDNGLKISTLPNRKVVATREGVEHIFDSPYHAAKALKGHQPNILRAIKNGKTACGGFSFHFI